MAIAAALLGALALSLGIASIASGSGAPAASTAADSSRAPAVHPGAAVGDAVNAPVFVSHLVAETRRLGEESAARANAASALAALETQSLTLSPAGSAPGDGESIDVHATGLLPNYPATLTVADRTVTLPAPDTRGDIDATVTLATAPTPGSYTASLQSLLITETAAFQAT